MSWVTEHGRPQIGESKLMDDTSLSPLVAPPPSSFQQPGLNHISGNRRVLSFEHRQASTQYKSPRPLGFRDQYTSFTSHVRDAWFLIIPNVSIYL